MTSKTFFRAAASLAAALACAMSAGADELASTPVDLLAFSNGGLFESASSTYGGGWLGLWLIDEEPGTGWANEEGAKPPFEVVLSVPEQSKFTRFVFDTASAENPERSAKDIDILVSDQSATSRFVRAASMSLQSATDGQSFDLKTPAVGRWVKLVVKTNHGDDKYWEIMNVRGFGVPLTDTPLKSVSGTYDSERFGRFHLQQTGAQLAGCYEYDGGLVLGGLESHLMRLTWTENKGEKKGPAVMVQTRDGRGFQGLWRLDGDQGWNDNWKLKKISDKIGACPHWKPAGLKNDGKSTNVVAETLAKAGRVRLYGINFDSDSDRLRADAAPALAQLVGALKANKDWKITVEGHTDSTSTPTHNKDLSARRAASVKAYLAKEGVAATRVATEGFGQDKPVASNESTLGRAQNRRVEVVRE